VIDVKRSKASVNLMFLSCISVVITVAFYFVNVWLLSDVGLLKFSIIRRIYSPTDFLFFEGIVFLILGALFLLGRGGINLWSVKAAILSALAETVYHKDTIGPDEEFRRDRWKPGGFTRFALILILAGVFMILVYFLAL